MGCGVRHPTHADDELPVGREAQRDPRLLPSSLVCLPGCCRHLSSITGTRALQPRCLATPHGRHRGASVAATGGLASQGRRSGLDSTAPGRCGGLRPRTVLTKSASPPRWLWPQESEGVSSWEPHSALQKVSRPVLTARRRRSAGQVAEAVSQAPIQQALPGSADGKHQMGLETEKRRGPCPSTSHHCPSSYSAPGWRGTDGFLFRGLRERSPQEGWPWPYPQHPNRLLLPGFSPPLSITGSTQLLSARGWQEKQADVVWPAETRSESRGPGVTPNRLSSPLGPNRQG
ncbi:uncharacterized protein LOC110350814 [Heterocephalus glaber]|uniref:Uncharacterized protein LOC110350814 n=1 Tax=Heterocephalus glaber TaxID=10181 RepID=A0AAX6TJA3_HETGA|nr:uncharacterized protein LOC110350814 [Heterocephalus glaber]